MADGQNVEDNTNQTSNLSGDQTVFLGLKSVKTEAEDPSPIPGFPPFFQFAKLQTEASSWGANAGASSSTSSYEFAEKTQVVKTEPCSPQQSSSEEINTTNSSSVKGVDPSSSGENPWPGLGNVTKIKTEDEEMAEDNEIDKGEEKVEEAAANDDPDEEEAESDPYFYTKRDEFTSEIYKIELQNLPKKCGYKVSYA